MREEEKGQDDQELLFEETSEDLKKLIVYCRSISIKPWNWRKQRQTSVSEMFSFGEPLAIKLCSKSQRGRIIASLFDMCTFSLVLYRDALLY